jgi:V/A-type H+-transporting ATPase subunit F
MKAFLISDNVDTLVGLKFAGIDGIVLHEREEIIKKIDEVKLDKEIGILIFTEISAGLVKEIINELKLSDKSLLIVEIADRHGSSKGEDHILRYIKESIGLKL